MLAHKRRSDRDEERGARGGGSSAQNQRGGDWWVLQTVDPESRGKAPGSGLLDGKARGKGVERTPPPVSTRGVADVLGSPRRLHSS